jgi:hypothetical protein
MSLLPGQPERRRAERYALQLPASIRESGGGRVPTVVIDISTHGCRIESRASFNRDKQLWLYLANLAAIEARIIWCRDCFAGLEFSVPLHQAILDSLIGNAERLATSDLEHLQDISKRSRWLAQKTQALDGAEELARLSRDCTRSVIAGKFAAVDDSKGNFPPGP